jgi:hypothetical protein
MHLYGQVSQEDGVWRDRNDNQVTDVIGIDPGKFSREKGIMGAVERFLRDLIKGKRMQTFLATIVQTFKSNE